MFLTNYFIVISLSFLAGFATLIGALIAPHFKKNIKGTVAGLSFAAGIMILISLFELIPKSLVSLGTQKTSIALFLSVLSMVFINYLIPHTHLIKEKRHEKSSIKAAYLTAFGIILHDFPEGFAIASAYIFSTSLGLLVILATFIHNIPEGFAMAIPGVALNEKRFVYKTALFSGLSGLLGSIVGIFTLHILPALDSFFMSLAAGAMLFVAIHELLPMARKYKENSFLALGILLSFLTYGGLFLLFPQ